MSLRVLTRKTKMQLTSTEDDVCELLFAQKKSRQACRLFLNELKKRGGLTRSELSQFSKDLSGGKIKPGFRYDHRTFYRQIRHTLLTVGLIAIEQRFVSRDTSDLSPERVKPRDIVDKYVAVRQPITKRPPDGLNLVRLTWVICQKWNEEFLEEK
jgi:hypothetical protein